MTVRSHGLGRGLGALFPLAEPGRSGLLSLPLSAISSNPRQPRGSFDEADLTELAESLHSVGLLQPVVVRPLADDRYELVAGERRFRAARLAGFEEIPAVVRNTADADLLTEALVENLHRADLNPLEEAAAFQQLRDDFGITHEQLATRLGKSRSAVSNALRLLTLPPELQHRVANGSLSAGHARALLALSDPAQQRRIASRVVADGLSVRATEELVRRALESVDADAAQNELGSAARGRAASPFPDLQRELSETLSTKVRITGTAKRGRVVIEYAGPEDLDRLAATLLPADAHR
jgi:ParB family chromosome partitioning protein